MTRSGLIERLRMAAFKIPGFAGDSERCWRDHGRAWGKQFHLPAKTGANTKGAYRFLSNERVSEQDILGGHFQASAERFKATEGPILVLQDTTRSHISGSVLSLSATRARRQFNVEGTACSSR